MTTPKGSRAPPAGPITSTNPAIATTEPASTTSCGARRERAQANATSATGARYSMSSAVLTGIRAIAV